MERKSLPLAELKADDGTGSFEARVAVFGNVDKVGDRIEKGAFTRSLDERGLPPIYHSHLWAQGPIGETTSAVETDDGLEIKGSLYVEDPMVARIHRAMKAGQLREFSFAYEVVTASEDGDGDQKIRVLEDLDLFEVGPTLLGVNPDTGLLSIPKSLLEVADVSELFEAPLTTATNTGGNVAWVVEQPAKAGARNSNKDSERLQSIHDLSVQNGATCEPKSAPVDRPDPARAVELVFATSRGVR